MAKLDDQELVTRLGSGNGYQRDIAQRLLRERLLNDGDHKALIEDLTLAIAFPGPVGRDQGVFGVLISINSPETQMLLKTNVDDFHKSWAVRSAGDQKSLSDEAAEQIFALRNDPSPRVRLQVAIAAAKQKSIPTIPTLVAVLARAGDDPLVPRIVWQNLHPLLEKQTADFVAEVLKLRAADSGSFPKPVIDLLPRAADRILSTSKPDTLAVAELVKLLLSTEATDESADRCLQLLTARIRSGEISGDLLASIRKELEESLNSAMKANASRPSTLSAIELAASLKMEDAINRARQLVPQTNDEAVELRLVNALVTAGSADGLTFAEKILGSDRSAEVRRRAVQAIGRIGTAASTSALISQLPNLPADVQPAAIEALTDRADSATELLGLVRDGKVLSTLINANQAQKMLSLKSQPLADLVTKHWGIVRTERDPARVELIARMRNELRTSNGDPVAGRVVFKRLCAQCHKMYGEGAEVGPDITRNGRASFEQLLSNVFDPSLVIGSAYQGLTVATKEGRVVSGLPAEDSPQRVVLKVQGDKQEIIARGDIDEVIPSKLSLMPEGIEKQLQPKELHDLFAFITLDKPPEDPSARLLAGSRIVPGESSKFDEFPALLEQLLPGFTTAKVGEGGVAILADYHGRPAVRTHPVSRTEACRLTTSTTLPSASKVTLRLSVASHAQGDWQLTVNVNGEIRHQSIVKCKGKDVDWKEITIDLTDLAGQPVTLEMLNKANDWSNEFGYWNAAEILAE
jgi:putative heme-binding domain-containing protein